MWNKITTPEIVYHYLRAVGLIIEQTRLCKIITIQKQSHKLE